ncbi:MAG TPA: F0F1 ATP synthase subunit A, partial [Fervidobacterium sp.]|nr:F0F1 ATP synthase subunit A [Fervidobacterium sp.]
MAEKKRRRMSTKTKIQLTVFLIVYITVGIINVQYLPKSPSDVLGNVANRWIVGNGPWFLQINPMTIIMSLVVIAIIVLFARAVHKEYSLVPNRKQAFAES